MGRINRKSKINLHESDWGFPEILTIKSGRENGRIIAVLHFVPHLPFASLTRESQIKSTWPNRMTLIYLYGYDQRTFSVMKAQRGCLIERLRRIIKSNVFRTCCASHNCSWQVTKRNCSSETNRYTRKRVMNKRDTSICNNLKKTLVILLSEIRNNVWM